MRLTSFTDFGLRALMRLAVEEGGSLTVEAIAQEFGISSDHLTKVVRDLARHGFVGTQRGVGGGVRLARPASDIRLGEVVRVLEERHALVECFRADGGACVLEPRCRLKQHLEAARAAFLAELDRTTLAECAYPPVASRVEG